MKQKNNYKEEIVKLPLTTNRLDVYVDKEALFAKYAIISYSSNKEEYKHLAYEQLGKVPTLSVTGIWARWMDGSYPFVKFFILSEKDKANEVLESLRQYQHIRSNRDDLESYDASLQKRIIASLAINSLGKKKNDRLMYNDGSLLVRDDTNFGIKPFQQDLVCLKIEVNEYMNIIARTTSFMHPYNTSLLASHKNCVFHEGKYVDGCLWSGEALKPILIDTKRLDKYNLKELYINKQKRKKKSITVPYWPYNKERYMHGKLFAITQVVDSVNEAFQHLIKLDFHDYEVWKYDEHLSGDAIMSRIKEEMRDITVTFIDPFKTEGSQALIDHIKEEMHQLMEGHIQFETSDQGGKFVIKLCEPKPESDEKTDKKQATHYSKFKDRIQNSNNVLQHVTHDEGKLKESISKASARRILMDMMIKDFIVRQSIPSSFQAIIDGWEFLKYRLRNGMVLGAQLTTDRENGLHITPIGLAKYSGESYDYFVRESLKYNHPEKIKGTKDYRVLKKGGNVYIIIDTEEIPILNAELIDEGYDECIKEGVTISKFKRKDNIHHYMRGYIGFHMWRAEGMDDQYPTSYSYICGKNKEYIQIRADAKMDKMPRARRIFVLHADAPERIEKDMIEIIAMLKQGLGRWNEMMTYPFPFKMLFEYLDDWAEQAHGIHWSKVGTKNDPEQISYSKE